MNLPLAGICNACVHQKLIRSGRGSVFSMCLRHRTQPEYPKYPRLPVERCPGYEPRAATRLPEEAPTR